MNIYKPSVHDSLISVQVRVLFALPLFYDYEMKIDLLFQKKNLFAYCEISDIY